MLKLTKDHITFGRKNNCRFCPLALCFKDEFHTDDVIVGDVQACINGKLVELTPSMKTFIFRFDRLTRRRYFEELEFDVPWENTIREVL